ncbi:MAG TPA: hypothetical protein VMX14_13235 [Anaerolineae bacterium]|nr:hypothetical protein [Anaerolineae bacterium]
MTEQDAYLLDQAQGLIETTRTEAINPTSAMDPTHLDALVHLALISQVESQRKAVLQLAITTAYQLGRRQGRHEVLKERAR